MLNAGCWLLDAGCWVMIQIEDVALQWLHQAVFKSCSLPSSSIDLQSFSAFGVNEPFILFIFTVYWSAAWNQAELSDVS